MIPTFNVKPLTKFLSAIFFVFAALVPLMGWGQVTISGGTATAGACPGYPTAAVTVSNIVIDETAITDFNGTNLNSISTIVLCPPTGWEFVAGTGSVANTGAQSDIVIVSIVTTTTQVTITLDGDGNNANSQNEDDQFTISGIQVVAIAPGPPPVNPSPIERCGGTLAVNGLVNGTDVANLTVANYSAPTVSLSSGAGTNNQTLCQNTAGPSPLITFAVGGSATGATVSGLPAGMSGTFSAGTFTISGTPTAAPGSYPYTVTTTGMAPCAAVTATGTITVVAPVSALSYSTPVSYCTNIAITNNTPTVTGGGTITYSVSPALPAGLSLNTSTGVISGTPTAVTAAANYTVTATNGCSSRNATVNITVVAGPTASTNGGNQNLASCTTTTTLTGNTPTVGTGLWTVSPLGPVITTASNPTSGVTGLVPGTTYTFTWTITSAPCGSSASSMTVLSPIGPGCVTYCTPAPVPGATTTTQITNVTFNTINNNSAGTLTGYQNFTATSTTVNEGQVYNISVTASSDVDGVFSDASCVTVYIDWNSDGDFIDASETNSLTTSFTGTQTFGPLPITVPCGALTGVNLRMRIIVHDTDCTNPCILTGEGQVEDYTIIVTAAVVPSAFAGADQNISCTSTANLSATATPATGFWSLVSGSGSISSPTSTNTSITGLTNGTSVFEWTTLGSCATATDQVSIVVTGVPDVPVNAGNDVFTCLTTLTLNGSDPSPGTGQWSVVSGPNTPSFAPSTANSNSIISGLTNGTYVLQWSVDTDGAGGCAPQTDNVTITIGTLPAPNAGLDQTICPTGAVLNGNDFDGAIGTWSVFSGPAGSGFVDVNDPNTTIYDLVPGSYVLRWTVSGGGCAGTLFDAVTITVNACTTAVTHGTTSNQTFYGCSYTYSDNGGPGGSTIQNAAGNYSNGISQTWTTFCPDDPNSFATITFNTSTFYPGDYLVVYDDSGPASPIVAGLFYDGSPGGGQVQNPPLGTTITSSTGCLYVQMNTTSTNNYPGFTATVGCSNTAGVQNTDFITVNQCGGGGGITLCQGGSIPAVADVTTNPPDLGNLNSGCLGSQENASNTWVYIVAETDGYIAFEISPAGGQDFDYAIWGPYDGGYACPGMTSDSPIRCSWAVNGGASCPADIGLGIVDATNQAVASNDFSEGGTCSSTNEGWTYPILASAGDVYVLLFQNFGYNNSSFGVTINTDPALIPGGGTYASLGCDPPQALPVELISFVGEHSNRVNKLYWNCASESKNDFFTIEKSADGIKWEILTTVDGAGYSQELTHYSTMDPSPYAGITYYRLLQTDFDGKSRKYKTISISTEIEIVDLFSHMYPNPTSGTFYFNYGGKDFENEIIVNVYNTAGQLVTKEVFKEFNSSQSMSIETIDMTPGIYQVELIQNGHREMKKVSILK